jgi:hypothetical protein
VFGALGDICIGGGWDPDRRSLFLHLHDVIRYRVRDQARLARRRRNHGELDEDDSGESLESQAAAGAILPTAAASNAKLKTLGDFVVETIAALRPLAVCDHEVTSFLDVLVKRIVDRNDVLEDTGMTNVEYNNAWRRLDPLANQLPVQLVTIIGGARLKRVTMKNSNKHFDVLEALAGAAARVEENEGRSTPTSRAAADRYQTFIANRMDDMRRAELRRHGVPAVGRRSSRSGCVRSTPASGLTRKKRSRSSNTRRQCRKRVARSRCCGFLNPPLPFSGRHRPRIERAHTRSRHSRGVIDLRANEFRSSRGIRARIR